MFSVTMINTTVFSLKCETDREELNYDILDSQHPKLSYKSTCTLKQHNLW